MADAVVGELVRGTHGESRKGQIQLHFPIAVDVARKFQFLNGTTSCIWIIFGYRIRIKSYAQRSVQVIWPLNKSRRRARMKTCSRPKLP
jgi:hypothetical protein